MPRVAAPGPKPWEVEGISRSKYFRNKREKKADAPKRPSPKKLRAVGPKRRGRPPGSKNKNKLTLLHTAVSALKTGNGATGADETRVMDILTFAETQPSPAEDRCYQVPGGQLGAMLRLLRKAGYGA